VLHALGGCDTTSAIYGHGKGTVFSKINKDSKMHLHCTTLQNSEASVDDVCKAGVQLMVAIYGGKPGDSLECLRYAAYCSTSLSRRFQAERLPPSESAARLHAMRVHLQAVVWGTLGRSALKPTQWGWSLNNGRLVPVQIEGQVAPDSVLTVVRCKCKGDCLSALCSCKKHGLQCVTACSNCHGTDCSNALPHNAHDIDEDSDVDDDTVNTECTDVNYLPDFLWDDDLNFQYEEEV
jgi:hypothetical protein